ncbi:hypothetical protein FLCU109888_11180 [Flavobacterium cucumis]|uniref:Uncharacterized protein n=2 Tax=Flavobacterium cucumis TaxID=416016 RepID=A0A1M8A096_9FLAO|nr:hypothetical protein SAMN05443547_2657 [Flavobacterium cucumis]
MKNYITIMLLLATTTIFAQETKKELEKEKTKIDAFASKTGSIIKLTDYKLSGIKTLYGGLSETRIRKINSGSLISYFFQIEKQGKYSTATASIEYSDLLEVIKAINSLKTEVEKDLATNPEYLENKFTTVDGFKVGYMMGKGKITWFLQLEKYGSDNTIFIENLEMIEKAFEEAKIKIDELKK